MSGPVRAVRQPQLPPRAPDAEDAVLRAALADEGALDALMALPLRANQFALDKHQVVYTAALAVRFAGRPVNPITVTEHLRDVGQLERVGGTPFLVDLVEATPYVRDVVAHAEIIIAKWREREAAAIGRELVGGLLDAAAARTRLDALSRETTKPAWAAIDAEEIFAPLAPLRHVIPAIDLCPGAVALWAGFGYSGKTLVAQAAELAIAAGMGKVWNCFASATGRAMHIDYEQGKHLTRERYQRLAFGMMLGPADLTGKLRLVSMPNRYLDQVGAEGELERLVDGFSLVVIDSLRAAAPTLDENSSSVRSVLDMLSRVSERTGAAFVVIHHARKPNQAQQGGAKMAIRGSGAIFDACGSVLVFESEKGEPVRVTHEKARASGRLVDDFQLDIMDVPDEHNPRAGLLVTAEGARSRIDVADDQARDRKLAQIERVASELRELFRLEPELRGVEPIAGKLGRDEKIVRKALSKLIDSGEVEAIGTTRDKRHRWLHRE